MADGCNTCGQFFDAVDPHNGHMIEGAMAVPPVSSSTITIDFGCLSRVLLCAMHFSCGGLTALT